ncbi:glycosyl hydrolase family 18 protein [Sediminitomix flava]|uniref:chitinase n=1 Tax=Sediminitomix flava TaxID=379075 RepID=A0A315YYI0_SEDFL|nr:glycosyl hydrolase family 18 protein [Sediminitomix flava]PWJ35006.1 putative secreted protein (Por secretion system target) [Sediminitomix flava]
MDFHLRFENSTWSKALMVLLSCWLSFSAQVVFGQANSGASHSTTDHQKEIIGYFTQWDAWKDVNHGVPAKGAYNQLNIDYSQYTILNFSFFGVAKDGTLHSGDLRNKSIYQAGQVQEPGEILHPDVYSSWDYWLLYGELDLLWEVTPEAEAAGYTTNGTTWSNSQTGLSGQMPIPMPKEGGAPGLLELCKQNGVKAMASIGGWSMCKHFPEMARDPQLRANFINDCVTLINMGFDGIDLDWEYPGSVGMNIENYGQDDYQNFTTLVQEIRDAIGADKLITAAFSAQPAKLVDFEWAALEETMDYFNMMSYDFHGGWSNIAGHNSPLYSYEGEEYGAQSWNDTFQALVGMGVSPSKINMGVGFYGRGVITDGAADLNAPTVKVPKTVEPDGPVLTAGDFTNFGLFDATPTFRYIDDHTSDWTYHWDDEAKVPYLTKDNYFLSFDNEQSIQLKAEYVNDNNIGGVIVWHIFGDLDFQGIEETYASKLPYDSRTKAPLVNTLNSTFALNDGSPSIAFTAPTNNSVIEQSTSFDAITLSAIATDTDGAISSVTFKVNGGATINGTASGSSYTASFTPDAFGSYTVVATATDNSGATSSTQTTFSVLCVGGDCPNENPVVSIDAPIDGSTIQATSLAPISIEISASDLDGSIASTSIVVDGHTFTSSPASWTPSAFGDFTIEVTVTDDKGATASASSSVSIVETCGTPWSAQTFPTGSEVSYNGFLYKAGWEAGASQTPGTADVWKLQSACPGTVLDCSQYDEWDSATTYQSNGMEISFNGNVYSLLTWWSVGKDPELNPSVWSLLAPCDGGVVRDDAPSVDFVSPNGNTSFTQANFEAISIEISVSDDNTVVSSSIEVDGVTTNGTTASFTPSSYGDFVVTASATDDANQITTKSITLSILQPGLPSVSFSAPSNDEVFTVTSLSPISISVNTTDADNVEISVDGQTFNGTSASWIPSDFGSYTISATATNATGSVSETISVTVEEETVTEGCAGVEEYKSYAEGGIYNSGDQVSYEGILYEAQVNNLYNVLPGTANHWWKSLGPCTGSSNEAPVVSFTAPSNNATIIGLVATSIAVEASDADGTVASVSISVDGQTFDASSTSWTPSAYGVYTISATATDDQGASTTSSISVNVEEPQGPQVPVVSFTNLTDGQNIKQVNLSSISIVINATDADGTITASSISVDGQTFDGTTAFWTPSAFGSYTITASATDNENQTTTSSIQVTVSENVAFTDQVLVGYWHNWENASAPYMRLRDVDLSYNVINASFAEPTLRDIDNTMVFNPIDINNQGYEPTAASRQAFIEDVAYLQSLGKKVQISIGGANGVVHLDNETEQQKFVTSMIDIIETYGFDGMDIDLEGSSLTLNSGDLDFKNPTTPRIVYFIEGIKQIVAHFNGALMLTAAPETAYVQGGAIAYGGSWGGYLPILYALKDDLNFVHVQLYNTGSMLGLDGQAYTQGNSDFIVAMCEMMLQGFETKSPAGFFPAFREDQVAIGLPATPPAAPAGGYAEPSEVQAALNYLVNGIPFGGSYTMVNPSGYPNFRGMMTWSVNWDATGGYSYADNFETFFGPASRRAENVKEISVLEDVTAFPNPFSGKLSIKLSSESVQEVTLRFISVSGQVMEQEVHQVQGSKTIRMSLPKLDAGIYILQTISDDKVSTQKLIKE